MRKIITTIAIACAAIVSNGQTVPISSLTIDGLSSYVVSPLTDGFDLSISGIGSLDNSLTKQSWESLEIYYDWTILPTTAGILGLKTLSIGGNGVYTITAFSKANTSIISNSIEVSVSGFVPISGVTIAGTGVLSTLLAEENLTYGYLPLDATKPNLKFVSNSKCTVLTSNSDATIIKAKNNGSANVSLEIRQFGLPVVISNIVPFVVTNQTGYRETFKGPWDGNTGAQPVANFNPRTSDAGASKQLNIPGQGWWISSLIPYSFTDRTGGGVTRDGLFVTATTLGTGFPDTFNPSWTGEGTTRVTLQFAKDDCGINVSTAQPVLIDVENKTSNPMPIKFYILDNNSNKGFAINEPSTGIGTFETTIAGNTRSVVNIPTLPNVNVIGGVALGTSNFNGDFGIHSINVGYNVPTAFSIVPSAGSLVALADNMTVSGVFADENVIKEVSWSLLNPSTAPGLVTLAQLPDLSKTIINYSDFDGKTGVATLVGTMFGSTVTSTLLIEVPTKSAKVQVIHNSPDAPAVDVMVNGLVVAGNVSFHQASGFLDVNLFAPTTVQLALAGTKTVAYTEVFNLSPDMSYRVIASGFATPGSTPGLDLFPSVATTTVTSGNVALDIYHSSPNAPAVGVVARGVATLVSAFSYGFEADNVVVPSGTYILDIKAGNASGSTVASFIASLTGFANQKVAVLASGNYPTTFGLIAVTSDGTVITLPGAVALVTSTIGGATMVTIAGMSTYSSLGFNPSNATTPINTMWFSSNTAVATIDGMTGVLTALSEGTTDITAKHYNVVSTITSNIITVSVSGTTSISEASVSSSSVVVSPNPTSDVVSISSSSVVVGVKVYSTTGVLVSSSTSSSVSLSGVASGLYILEITTANGVVRKTVVKN